MTDAEIGPARTNDLDELVDLWAKLVRGQQPYGTLLLVAENETVVRNWLSQLIVFDGIRTARIEDRPIGFVTFEMDMDRFSRSKTSGFIHNLFVESAYREAGVGSKLLEQAEQVLRNRGADRVRLEVMATNERACDFYDDRGYLPHRVRYHKLLETDNHNSSAEKE